jgi:hypothetical protein
MEKSSKINCITFPKNEWVNIRIRLNENKPIWTIRVDKEYGKYKVGDILETEWDDKIEIISVKKIDSGIKELEKEYQFFNELTKEMIKELKPYTSMELISLQKYK